MSLWETILSWFGRKPEAAADNGKAYMGEGGAKPVVKHNKNVYDEARTVPVPDWAQGLNNTDLASQLRQHAVCKYVPAFGWKKIMTTTVGPDGNLVPEYDGIAGDCGAVKNFGMKVAQHDGRTMPYKYVDLNMAYRCCCGIPKKCPFYLMAIGEMEATNARRS